jgi:hypothetical protein
VRKSLQFVDLLRLLFNGVFEERYLLLSLEQVLFELFEYAALNVRAQLTGGTFPSTSETVVRTLHWMVRATAHVRGEIAQGHSSLAAVVFVAAVYWQLTDQRVDDQIWMDLCRVKHVTTERALRFVRVFDSPIQTFFAESVAAFAGVEERNLKRN